MLFTPIKREYVFDTRVDASQDLSGRYSFFLVLETFLKSALSAIVEPRCDTIFTLIALKNVFFFWWSNVCLYVVVMYNQVHDMETAFDIYPIESLHEI